MYSRIWMYLNLLCFPHSACPKIVELFGAFFKKKKVDLLSHSADCMWLILAWSAVRVVPNLHSLTQPVAPAVKKGREPPSLPISWHHTAACNTAREGARGGLVSNDKFRTRIWFLVWEVLYQLSISTSHPSLYVFLLLSEMFSVWGVPQLMGGYG